MRAVKTERYSVARPRRNTVSGNTADQSTTESVRSGQETADHAPVRLSRYRLASFIVILLTVAGCESTPPPEKSPPYPPDKAGECTMKRMATVPVLTATGPPVIEVTLNGKPAAMIVGTGAQTSAVSAAAVKAFGLVETGTYAKVYGTTGGIELPFVHSDRLLVGRADASDFALFEMRDRRRDAPMPSIGGLPLVGELGTDFLRHYEVWFDLPEGVIILAQPRRCTLKDVAWDASTDQVPIEVNYTGRADVPIRLDGHKVDAMLSSSSSTTTITPDELDWFGIRSTKVAANHAEIVRGVNGLTVSAHRRQFADLEIGTEKFSDVWLTVAPMEAVDAVLGSDFFRNVVFWLSFRQKMIYIEKGKVNPFASEHPSSPRRSEEQPAPPA